MCQRSIQAPFIKLSFDNFRFTLVDPQIKKFRRVQTGTLITSHDPINVLLVEIQCQSHDLLTTVRRNGEVFFWHLSIQSIAFNGQAGREVNVAPERINFDFTHWCDNGKRLLLFTIQSTSVNKLLRWIWPIKFATNPVHGNTANRVHLAQFVKHTVGSVVNFQGRIGDDVKHVFKPCNVSDQWIAKFFLWQ